MKVRDKEEQADTIARILDTALSVPGLRSPVGFDPLVGMLPIVGDLLATMTGATILVTGCAAELSPAMFESLPGVSRVVGNASKLNAFAANDVKTPLVPAGLLSQVKSFVAVQTGCDHRCLPEGPVDGLPSADRRHERDQA